MVNDFLSSTVMQGFVKRFCLLEQKQVPDGVFGSAIEWAEGMQFDAAERHETTIEAQAAEQAGTSSTYSLYVDRSLSLHYPDRIRRMEDGQEFEVTTGSAETLAPDESGMNLALVRCKKVVLS